MRFRDAGHRVEREVLRILEDHVGAECQRIDWIEHVEPVLHAIWPSTLRTVRLVMRKEIERCEEARLRTDREQCIDRNVIGKLRRAWISQHVDQNHAAHAVADNDKRAFACFFSLVGFDEHSPHLSPDFLPDFAFLEVDENIAEEETDRWRKLSTDSVEAQRRDGIANVIRHLVDGIEDRAADPEFGGRIRHQQIGDRRGTGIARKNLACPIVRDQFRCLLEREKLLRLKVPSVAGSPVGDLGTDRVERGYRILLANGSDRNTARRTVCAAAGQPAAETARISDIQRVRRCPLIGIEDPLIDRRNELSPDRRQDVDIASGEHQLAKQCVTIDDCRAFFRRVACRYTVNEYQLRHFPAPESMSRASHAIPFTTYGSLVANPCNTTQGVTIVSSCLRGNAWTTDVVSIHGGQPRETALKTLQDGHYPFREEYHPLTAMVMTEAPPELEAFLAAQAKASGIEIVRDEPVELVCAGPDMETNRFLVFWPSGSERMHLLVPRHLAKGLA